MALYLEPAPAAPGVTAPSDARDVPRPIELPARLAIAQLGEVTPPDTMLQALRADETIFASVQPVPGAATFSHAAIRTGPGPQDWRQPDVHEQAQKHLESMLSYSRDIGARYLFVFGGTADYGTRGTALSAADLTIIGAFIVPGKMTEAQLKASGVLIDVETGRALLSVSADEAGKKRSTAVRSEAAEAQLLAALRDKVSVELASALGREFRQQAQPAQGG
jgi:hypothetical protein